MGGVKFDIIFMDIRMPISKSHLQFLLFSTMGFGTKLWFVRPVVDGEAAARMIKSTINMNTSTPIVAVTAYEHTVQLAGAFDDILNKPVTTQIILNRLKHFCDIWNVPTATGGLQSPAKAIAAKSASATSPSVT
jgi:CheY-like chemotaxis protein